MGGNFKNGKTLGQMGGLKCYNGKTFTGGKIVKYYGRYLKGAWRAVGIRAKCVYNFEMPVFDEGGRLLFRAVVASPRAFGYIGGGARPPGRLIRSLYFPPATRTP